MERRSRRLDKPKQGGSAVKARQYVVVCDERVFDSDEFSATIFVLPHPKSGDGVRLVLSASGKELFEVKKHTPTGPSSWLVGESVQKDGGLYVITRIDPLFVLIPQLAKHAKKGLFMMLPDLLVSSDWPSYSRLEGCVGLDELQKVCNSRQAGDITAFLLDDDRVLQWLERKVRAVAQQLLAEGICVGNVSRAALLAGGEAPELNAVTDAHLEYAVGLVAEYLHDSYVDRLADRVGVILGGDLCNVSEAESLTRHPNTGGPVEDYSTAPPPAKKPKQAATAGRRKLEKADITGMQSIKSFFSKK